MEGDLGTLEGFFGRKIKLELKYRGSRDGFHYDKIRPLVKDQSDLITIIKSEHNKIFGGYISKPFDYTYNSKK